MANPFLVLGGIAVGIIAASFGILQVPGWVDSAHDASVSNDLASVKIAQAAVSSTGGRYFTDLDDPILKSEGLRVQRGGSTRSLDIYVGNGAWCAVAESRSDAFLAASSATSAISKAATREDALAEVKCNPDGSPMAPPAPEVPSGPADIVAVLRHAPTQNYVGGWGISWAASGGVYVDNDTLVHVKSDGKWAAQGPSLDVTTPWAFGRDGSVYAISLKNTTQVVKLAMNDRSGGVVVGTGLANTYDRGSLAVSPNGTVYYGEVNTARTELTISRVTLTGLVETRRVPVVINKGYNDSWQGYPFTVDDSGNAAVVTGATHPYAGGKADPAPAVIIASANGAQTVHKLDPAKTWQPKAQITHTGGFIVPSFTADATEFLETFPNGHTRTITIPYAVDSFDYSPTGELALLFPDSFGLMAADGDLPILGWKIA